VLKKSPVAPNVQFDFTAELTEHFSGADITELCQRSAKSAIRDAIMAEEDYKRLNPAKDGEDVDMTEVADAVPVITRKHFEEAFANARKSVSLNDLKKFDDFRIKMDPAYAKKSGQSQAGPQIRWPDDNTSQFQNATEDDLYD